MINYRETANPNELIDYLIDLFPMSDRPFQAPWIVVPNREFQNWIDREIAKKVGSSPHYNFVFPFEFIWKLYRLIDPNVPRKLPTDIHALTFKIFELLTNNERVNTLFGEFRDQTHRFALAIQIADVFDQYINIRPHMLFEWEDDSTTFELKSVSKLDRSDFEDKQTVAELLNQTNKLDGYVSLQKELWHSLNKILQREENHKWSRIQIYRNWLAHLKRDDLSDSLPADIYFVGERDWNRLLVESVELISEHTNVHLLNYPAIENDITNKSKQSINRSSKASNQIDLALPMEQGFMGHMAEKWREHGAFSPYLSAIKQKLDSVDNSLTPTDHWFTLSKILSTPGSINVCHSIKREVEVLKDDLLHFLNTSEPLDMSEISISVPDVEVYAPIIKQVFDLEPSIPVYLYDGEERPLQDSFLALLDLASTNCKMSDFMDTLTDPNIMERYGFEEAELGMIRDWIVADHIHFGLDDAHEYSLSTALNAWWRGYFVEHLSFSIEPGIAPSKQVKSSDQLTILSKLQRIYDELLDLKCTSEEERLNIDWLIALRHHFVRFFKEISSSNPRGYNWVIQNFEQLEEELAYAPTVITFEVFLSWFRTVLVRNEDRSSSFGTGVLVSSYIPNRLLPFSYSAMLGLNEREFPGNPQRPVFDLIHQQPQEGERQRKKDRSRLFIERLALTESRYFLSYIGRDAHTNTEKNPSPLITQLLYLHKGVNAAQNESGELIPFKKAPLNEVDHRLHGFAEPYFNNTEGIHSFSLEHFQQYQSLYENVEANNYTFFADNTLVIKTSSMDENQATKGQQLDPRIIDLDDLIRFYLHPTRYYLENVLHLQDSYTPLVIQDFEAYTMNGLEKYDVKHRIWEALGEGIGCKESYEYLKRTKMIPPHKPYYAVYEELFEQLNHFYSLIREQVTSIESKSVCVKTQKYILEGELPTVSDGEYMEYRLGNLRAKHKVEYFIKHLLKAATGSQVDSHYYYMDKKNTVLNLGTIQAELAQQQLEQLIDWYVNAMHTKDSLIFFPESSLRYVEALDKKGDVFYALDKAKSSWKQQNKSYGFPGEGEDTWNTISWFGEDPINTEAFHENSSRFWANWLKIGNKQVLKG